tara:strand:- start:1703 stop:2044 length:342 start_codon:yes stop_codon:yes gene_type:complete
MSKIEIILSAILAISIIINIGVLTYARAAIVQLLFVSEELGDLYEMFNGFSNHLEDISNLEMFYGDETVNGLLEHSRSLQEQFETFEYIFSLTEEQKQKQNKNDTEEKDKEEA